MFQTIMRFRTTGLHQQAIKYHLNLILTFIALGCKKYHRIKISINDTSPQLLLVSILVAAKTNTI